VTKQATIVVIHVKASSDINLPQLSVLSIGDHNSFLLIQLRKNTTELFALSIVRDSI